MAANGLPDALWPLVWAPVQAGSLVGSLVIVAATAAVTRRKRLTLATLIAAQAGYWAAKGVKRLVTRERTAMLFSGRPLHERASGLGYLSGHSAVAFGLAAMLAPVVHTHRRISPSSDRSGRGVRPAVLGCAPAPRRRRRRRAGLRGGTVKRWALGLVGAAKAALRAKSGSAARGSWKLIQPGRIGSQYVTQPIAEHRRDRGPRLHPDAGEARRRAQLPGRRARPASAPRRRRSTRRGRPPRPGRAQAAVERRDRRGQRADVRERHARRIRRKGAATSRASARARRCSTTTASGSSSTWVRTCGVPASWP